VSNHVTEVRTAGCGTLPKSQSLNRQLSTKNAPRTGHIDMPAHSLQNASTIQAVFTRQTTAQIQHGCNKNNSRDGNATTLPCRATQASAASEPCPHTVTQAQIPMRASKNAAAHNVSYPPPPPPPGPHVTLLIDCRRQSAVLRRLECVFASGRVRQRMLRPAHKDKHGTHCRSGQAQLMLLQIECHVQ
jgi:hypothetical protein